MNKTNSMDHKLSFDGQGRSLMGRCSCGTVVLQSGHGTERQQIRRNFDRHVENFRRADELDAL